jgi:hypothetical protein
MTSDVLAVRRFAVGRVSSLPHPSFQVRAVSAAPKHFAEYLAEAVLTDDDGKVAAQRGKPLVLPPEMVHAVQRGHSGTRWISNTPPCSCSRRARTPHLLHRRNQGGVMGVACVTVAGRSDGGPCDPRAPVKRLWGAELGIPSNHHTDRVHPSSQGLSQSVISQITLSDFTPDSMSYDFTFIYSNSCLHYLRIHYDRG